MKQIAVSELKASCVRVLKQVKQSGVPIEILTNGELLAVVHPPPVRDRKASYGSMKHMVKGLVGDLSTPLEQDWEVLR